MIDDLKKLVVTILSRLITPGVMKVILTGKCFYVSIFTYSELCYIPSHFVHFIKIFKKSTSTLKVWKLQGFLYCFSVVLNI